MKKISQYFGVVAILLLTVTQYSLAADRYKWVEFYFDEQLDDRTGDGPAVTFEGSIEIDSEAEFDYNLAHSRDEDEISSTPKINLDFAFDDNAHLLANLSLRFASDLIWKSPDERKGEPEFEIDVAHFTLVDEAGNLAFTAGRWDVQDERTWLFDEELDGLHFIARNESSALELMYAREEIVPKDLLGEHDRGNPDNYYARFYTRPMKDHIFSIFGLHQVGRAPDDPTLTWVGSSLFGETGKEIDYWIEAAHVFGEDNDRKISGYGFDLGLTRTFKDSEWNPRFTAAFAFGSGDDGEGTDTAFRQTGLHGNIGRFGGRKRFQYYGEVLTPNLTNIGIATLGAGVKIFEKSSLDIVYHSYFQHHASRRIRGSALDRRPSGDDTHIGQGIDLVVGLREIKDFEIDLTGGAFLPGEAFDKHDDVAWRAAVEFKFSF